MENTIATTMDEVIRRDSIIIVKFGACLHFLRLKKRRNLIGRFNLTVPSRAV